MIQFWKPIADAPRDVSILLLIGSYAIEGYWDDDEDKWEVIDLPSHGCGCCSSENPEPTHWAPLPNFGK